MTECPCCSNQMLRHIRQNQVYWFCRHCWQAMPIYDLNKFHSLPSMNLVTHLGIQQQRFLSAVI